MLVYIYAYYLYITYYMSIYMGLVIRKTGHKKRTSFHVIIIFFFSFFLHSFKSNTDIQKKKKNSCLLNKKLYMINTILHKRIRWNLTFTIVEILTSCVVVPITLFTKHQNKF